MGGSPARSEERPWATGERRRQPPVLGTRRLFPIARALLTRRWQPSPVEIPTEASFAPLQPNAAP